MKKLFTIILAVLMVFAFSLTSYAVNYDYYAAVYKKDSSKRGGEDLTPITSGIMFQVLTAGSNTEATITKFADPASTSVTNPVTASNFASATVCNGMVKFRTTASTVDLIVIDTDGGFTAVVKSFSPNDHSIVIDETIGITHHGLVPYSASNNTATNTGVTFRANTAISDMYVEVVTVEATETMNVGSNGTAAGYRSGVSVATAGFVADTAVPTNGDNVDYWPATTYGTYLATALTGSALTTNTGGIARLQYIVTAAGTNDALYYTGSSGSVNTDGYIHYDFKVLR